MFFSVGLFSGLFLLVCRSVASLSADLKTMWLFVVVTLFPCCLFVFPILSTSNRSVWQNCSCECMCCFRVLFSKIWYRLWKYVALNESLHELVERVFLSAFIFVGVGKLARQDILQKKGISGNELVVWNIMVMAPGHANRFFFPSKINIICTSWYISHARCSLIIVLCRCISRWISVRSIWKCQTNFCLLSLCSV